MCEKDSKKKGMLKCSSKTMRTQSKWANKQKYVELILKTLLKDLCSTGNKIGLQPVSRPVGGVTQNFRTDFEIAVIRPVFHR